MLIPTDGKCDDFIYFLTLRIFSAYLRMDDEIFTLFELAIF